MTKTKTRYSNGTVIFLAMAKCLDIAMPYLATLAILAGVFMWGFFSGMRTASAEKAGASTHQMYTSRVYGYGNGGF